MKPKSRSAEQTLGRDMEPVCYRSRNPRPTSEALAGYSVQEWCWAWERVVFTDIWPYSGACIRESSSPS